jgi:putative FmdB family regulatory protein
MPRYDYGCQICSYEFEVFQRMKEEPLILCPACEQPGLLRLIGPPAIRTAKTFVRNRGTLLDQYGGDEAEVNRLVGEAKKQGYEPRATDIYEPCLAKRKGDPAAFLPASDPVGALKRVCQKRNIAAEGRGISIKSKPPTEPKMKRALVKSTQF